MSPTEVLLLAFLIGVIAGLRSLTAPAVVAWAAYKNWMHLYDSPLSFMGSLGAVISFALLALAEIVNDKLPATPSRTAPMGLIPRIILGGLAGACVGAAGTQSLALGAALGIVGSLAGTFGGYQARTGLVKALKVPDFAIALVEDAMAIAGGLFIVSRF